MSDALKKALRDEMFEVLNEGDLNVERCSTLLRLAESGRDLLQARAKKPEDFKLGTFHAGDGEAPAVNVETYGVKVLKELMPLLKTFRPEPAVQPAATTVELVTALAEARRLGLADVAKRLEEQLDLGGAPYATCPKCGKVLEDCGCDGLQPPTQTQIESGQQSDSYPAPLSGVLNAPSGAAT